MEIELDKRYLHELIKEVISKEYKVNLVNNDATISDDSFSYELKGENLEYSFDFRIQYDRLLTFEGFTLKIKKVEKLVCDLIIEELKKYYRNHIYPNTKDFYKPDYSFSQEITSEAHLEEFLSEFYKCLSYYEQEVFPKLLDIKFLADYVGSVPFERKAEIAVGGSFPVHLFKKIAILKWGNHSRYEEYKNETLKLIDLYAIKKPEKTEEVAIFKQGFDYLITHLENEPNPFIKE